MNWSPPKSDGGSPITEYIIKKKEKKGDWETESTVSDYDTSLKVNRLKEEVPYYFSVFAKNKAGISIPCEMTEPIILKKEPTPPSKPVGPIEVIDVQCNSITIKWKPSTQDGGSPITGYIVEKREENKTYWSKVETVDSHTTQLCCPNLREKTSYHFRVIAVNKIGQSEPLETDGATLAKSPFDVPSAPLGPLEVTNVTVNTADLEWKPPKSDGGSSITEYLIEVKTVGRSTWSRAGTVDGKTTQFTVKKLIEDTEYLFRVIAINAEGKSPPLEASDITKPTRKLSPPGPPRSVEPTKVGEDFAVIEWHPPKSDGGSPITNYILFKREKKTGDFTKVVTLKEFDSLYKVPNLKENTEYYFGVVAENKVGQGEIAETAKPVIPKKAATVPGKCIGPIAVTDVQRNSISIKWEPPKDDGGSPVTGYTVEKREASSSLWTKVSKVDEFTTQLKVGNLTEKTEYYFRVTAENKIGKGPPLETNDATLAKSPFNPPSIPIGPLEVDNVTHNSADLHWKAPKDDGGSPITGYIIEHKVASRSTWSKCGTVGEKVKDFTVSGLTEGTEYLFGVIAVNAEGQSQRLEATDVTIPTRVPGMLMLYEFQC